MKPLSPDTAPWAEKRMDELMSARSSEERFLMGMSMCETARQIVIDSIEQQWPELSPAEKRVKFFERYFGEDFSPERRAKIVERIRSIDCTK